MNCMVCHSKNVDLIGTIAEYQEEYTEYYRCCNCGAEFFVTYTLKNNDED